MSMASWKTTVTTEMPYLLTERTSVVLGMPASARSTGMVTYCSISSGESAGAEVITCTCTLVMSGTASTLSVAGARRPNRTKSKLAASTRARFRSDQVTRAVKSCTLVLFLGERRLEHRALEREHALGHDLLALLQARQDLDLACRRSAQHYVVQLE